MGILADADRLGLFVTGVCANIVGTRATLIASAKTRTGGTDFSLWFLNLIIVSFASLPRLQFVYTTPVNTTVVVLLGSGPYCLVSFNWLSVGRLERPRRVIGNTGDRGVTCRGDGRSDLSYGFLLWQLLERRALQGGFDQT
ncbi:MAG: hypothetical protein ABJC05_08940 [Pyrinomonadaceae bacterium]